MVILDTDALTIVQQNRGSDYATLKRRISEAADSHVVAVTMITFEEQARGWLAKIARARTVVEIERAYRGLRSFYDDFRNRTLVDFDERAISKYEDLRKSKLRVGSMDLRIASVALAHKATLISRNLRDFRKVPGLQVEDWTVA